MAVCVHNLPLVILLMLSLLQIESKIEKKINQNSLLMLELFHIYQAFEKPNMLEIFAFSCCFT